MSERDVEHHVRNIITTIPGVNRDDFEQGVSVRSGEADCCSLRLKVVIEVKDTGKIDPYAKRDRESQFEQLERYIQNLSEQGDLFVDTKLRWIGILTDGVEWNAWSWSPTGKDPRKMSKITEDINQTNRCSPTLQNWFIHITGDERLKSKRPPPTSLSKTLLTPSVLKEFERIQEDAEVLKSAHYKTKLELWHSVLEGSGMAHPDSKALQSQHLFRDHCLLVILSRLLVSSLTESTQSIKTAIGSGFHTWLLEIPDGEIWLKKIHKEFKQYEWSNATRDVLRDAYEDLIHPANRKQFGEHYTPSWLAEAVCQEVLDHKWCKEILKTPNNINSAGILDPACGSGTFLFAAIQRLTDIGRQLNIDDKLLANKIVELVHGIDIHPVATEMAVATVLLALPAPPDGGRNAVKVIHGDSLQFKVDAGKTLFSANENGIVIRSPAGREVTLSNKLLDSDKYLSQITSAVDKANYISKEKTSFTKEKELVRQLIEIIKIEGNGVWEWYLRNATGPFRLAQIAKITPFRLIGNPPWVTPNVISDDDRQRKFSLEAQGIGLGVKQQFRSRQDLAALFVHQSIKLYGKATNDKKCLSCGWVLPYAALKAGNWDQFRIKPLDDHRAGWTKTWNLKDVKERPFSGAAACVYIFLEDSKSSHVKHKKFDMKKGKKIEKESSWETAKECIIENVLRQYKNVLSDYSGRVTDGASTRPYVLCVGMYNKKTEIFSTIKSTKSPWNEVSSLTGKANATQLLPWRNGDSLIPFHVSMENRALLYPYLTNETIPQIWKIAENEWLKIRKTSSPKTLHNRINYNGLIESQLPLDNTQAKKRIIYNKSGSWLSAARLKHENAIIHDSLQHFQCASEQEACYLVSFLNAQNLQDAFESAKGSDRDYHNYIWLRVPIPLFNPLKKEHDALAKLCKKAEKIISKEIKSANLHSTIKKRAYARKVLEKSGIFNEINEQTQKILPEYVTN